MNKKELLPSLKAENHIFKEDGTVLEAMYRKGIPRQYRFNASEGRFNINGDDNITKSGEEFKLIPLAIRFFRDNLFERGRMNWCELFFLNAKNQVCCTMFHGYSVENLVSMESNLFYESLAINEIILKVLPQQKENKRIGSKYYIADFDFERADESLLSIQREAVQKLSLYRLETFNIEADNQLMINYAIKSAAALTEPKDMTTAKTTDETAEAEVIEKIEPQSLAA